MAYSAITNSEIDGESILDSTLFFKIRDNNVAMKDGTGMDNDVILQRHLADNIVGRDELKTSTEEDSTTNNSTQVFVTSAGEYSLSLVARNSVNETDTGFVFSNGVPSGDLSITTSYQSFVSLRQGNTALGTLYGQVRYFIASPPYDLGDGEIPLFCWALVGSGGEVISIQTSKTPPWAYNGPTDITKRRIKKLNEFTGEVDIVDRPITNEVKNADIDLVPHPFASKNETDTVILLDPPDTEYLMDLMEAGESVNELIHNDYIRISNQSINRSTPRGVIPAKFHWKNSRQRAGEAISDKRLNLRKS